MVENWVMRAKIGFQGGGKVQFRGGNTKFFRGSLRTKVFLVPLNFATVCLREEGTEKSHSIKNPCQKLQGYLIGRKSVLPAFPVSSIH